MDRLKKYFKMSNKQFKRIVGTTKPVFREMLALLETAFAILHIPGGKPPDLTPGDKLLMTLEYYREYRTMERIGRVRNQARKNLGRNRKMAPFPAPFTGWGVFRHGVIRAMVLLLIALVVVLLSSPNLPFISPKAKLVNG